jgi:hypothetical protein
MYAKTTKMPHEQISTQTAEPQGKGVSSDTLEVRYRTTKRSLHGTKDWDSI